jgi:hypothetical protein
VRDIDAMYNLVTPSAVRGWCASPPAPLERRGTRRDACTRPTRSRMVEGRAEPHRVVEDERDGQTTSHHHGRLKRHGHTPAALVVQQPVALVRERSRLHFRGGSRDTTRWCADARTKARFQRSPQLKNRTPLPFEEAKAASVDVLERSRNEPPATFARRSTQHPEVHDCRGRIGADTSQCEKKNSWRCPKFKRPGRLNLSPAKSERAPTVRV